MSLTAHLVDVEPGQRWAHRRTGLVLLLLSTDDEIRFRYEDDPDHYDRPLTGGEAVLRAHYEPVGGGERG